jgi:hypothetical protein
MGYILATTVPSQARPGPNGPLGEVAAPGEAVTGPTPGKGPSTLEEAWDMGRHPSPEPG